MRIFANVATVGKYKLKVINSLVHGGAYVAVHIKKRRVAWLSFSHQTVEAYEGTRREDLDDINNVVAWFAVTANYNRAARLWNDFQNGVTVPLLPENDGE